MEELSRSQVEYVVNTYLSNLNNLYGESDYYNSNQTNKNLVDLNNNPVIPSYNELREATALYKQNPKAVQDYSEFMYNWDGIYHNTLSNKVSLLAFDKREYCINFKDPLEFKSTAYKEDKMRVNKFFQKFNYKQEFKIASTNMEVLGAYFCWLRDSSGSFDENPIDLSEDYNIRRAETYALQMMPQDRCRITGRCPQGLLYDFDLNYFNQQDTYVENYDPSIIRLYNDKKKTGNLKSFINNTSDLNKTNGYDEATDGYVRVGINDGAWCFKRDMSNFNVTPPFMYLMKDVFNNDVVGRLQKDKDMISAYMILTGEMETKKSDNDKNPFMIDVKETGRFMKKARSAMDNNKIKPVPFPLKDIKGHQFQDYNTSMYKNQLSTSSSLGMNASDIVYSNEKLGEFATKVAIELDYNEIASKVYPQFENFLNFYVNKKTVKYKFKFKLSGSTVSFLRKDAIDYQMKLSDKGVQVPPSVWGSLYGYDSDEMMSYMAEAKYGDMQNLSFLMLNANTASSENVGNPELSIDERTDSGSQSHEY